MEALATHACGAANSRCNCCGRSWKVVQKIRLNAPASDRQASARQRLYRIASSVANHAWRGVAPRYRGRSDPDFAARAGRCRRSTCWSFEVHIVVPHHFGIRLGLVLPRPRTRTGPRLRTDARAVVATIWRSNPAPKSPPLSILVASISPHAARPWICALPAFAASSTATTFSEGAPGDRHAVAGAGAGRTVRPLRHGLVATFGAQCLAIIDQPGGPQRHRTNEMLGGALLGTLTVIITGLASTHPC